MNIKKLNNKNFNLDEIDQLNFDAWEMFDFPDNLTQDEKDFAVEFLDGIGIDVDDEYIVNFNARPNHLANMVVQIIRHYKSRNF